MSAGALVGQVVLNTRPSGQAQGLSALLRAAAAECIELPLLAIVPADAATNARALAAAASAQFVIFTSANAARLGANGLHLLPGARIYTLGAATAAALTECGLGPCIALASGGSEELLLLPGLQAPLDGQRGLIVTGEGGRDLLAPALKARGAQVTVARVYQRLAEAHPPQRVAASIAASTVVVLTSGEALSALLGLTPPAALAGLLAKPLLLPSARVASAATAAGFTGPLLLPQAMTDAALLARLLEWVRA